MRASAFTIFQRFKMAPHQDNEESHNTITMESTLGELSAVPKDWQYILESIAGNLIPKKGIIHPSWEDLVFIHI